MGNTETKRSKSLDKKSTVKKFGSFKFKNRNKQNANKTNNNNIKDTNMTNSDLNLSSSFNSSFNSNILKSKITPFENDYIYLNRKLGSGINGEVVLCLNKLDKKKYALKRLIDSKNARREVTLQWRSAFTCPHIVKIKDIYENKINKQKYLFVVMEYMEGGELFDKIKQRKKPFTEQEVAKIMIQICKAIYHLHSMGIAHRDLKPENILLESKDDNSIIKLSDFGFAKEAHDGLITPNYTPYYCPPEILRFQKYDISCDIWSLGVIMYILCCGYPPFYSSGGKRLSPGMEKRIKRGEYEFPDAEWSLISQEAKALIDGMLETQPESRLTIDQVMKNKWLVNFTQLPKKRLNSIKVMNQDKKNWPEILESMGKALNEMRVNYEQDIKLKKMTDVNNPLLKRRLAKSGKLANGLNLANATNDNSKLVENDDKNANDSSNAVFNSSLNTNTNRVLKKSSPRLKRVLSEPIPKSTLTALYYSTNLKEL